MSDLLAETLAGIRPVDRIAARAAAVRQRTLARPAGSLGGLDDAVLTVAAVRGESRPGRLPAAVSVLAGDHGVAGHGVSRFDPATTARVLRLIEAGRAPVNLLAEHAGAVVRHADVGLVEPVGPQRWKVAAGTADLSRTDAMPVEVARRALVTGIRYAHAELSGAAVVAVGEIGIGNTTAAAALAAAVLGRGAAEMVGPGTGVSAAGQQRKLRLVEAALARGRPRDPLRALAALGGLEIAANAGVILALAAAGSVPVLDGYISGVSALIASRLCPAVRGYLVAGHCSREPGHRAVLAELRLTPLLDLGLHLGMASGAALALGLLDASLDVAARTPPAIQVGLAGGGR